jgi:hypothetical protein
MQFAALQVHSAAWRVSRAGSLVATIDLHEEGRSTVVATTVDGTTTNHRFATPGAADRFRRDLTDSFACLDCEIEPELRVS